MKDNIQLPELFCEENKQEVFFYDYEASRTSLKNKIQFSKNVLCFILNGEKEMYNPTNYLNLTSNSIFILKSGCTLMSEKIMNQKPFKSFLFFFSDDFLLSFFDEISIQFSTNQTKKWALGFTKDQYILQFQNYIVQFSEKFQDENFMKIKLKEILYHLYQKYPTEIESFFATILQKEQVALQKIVEQNIEKNLSVEELAFLCNMSISTFKRKFASQYQTSPQKYFRETKMEKAKKLIKQSKKPSEIYMDLGYENLSSFSTEFKKYFGVSPTKI